MTPEDKDWPREREELNALRVDAPELGDEADHFTTCAVCGQAFDRRRLGDVLHHASVGHQPIPRD